LKQAVPYEHAVPGAVIAVQSFGDFLGFNPHLHVIATDGCFYGNGSFKACPTPKPKDLEDLFRYEVFKMLKAEGKITDSVIENMLNWHHSGFNVYCGNAIWPHNDEGLEHLARYIIRASFSQERMTYIPESADGVAKVIYDSKDGKTTKTFEALDWPRRKTAGCKHSPSWSPISRTVGNKWSDIMAFIVINHVAYEKKPAQMTTCRR